MLDFAPGPGLQLGHSDGTRGNMDTAVIVGTDPPVMKSAQELRGWTPEALAATTFRCPGCRETVLPKSLRPTNRVQAHYATVQNGKHIGCGLFTDVAAKASATAGQPSAQRVVLRPTRLVDDPERKVSGEQGSALPDSDDRRRTSRPTSTIRPGSNKPSGSAVAHSIRPFADAFQRMSKEERRQAPIELPGVDAQRYLFAFKRLPSKEITALPHCRVFYAQLRWTGDVLDVDGQYRVELFAGAAYDTSSRRYQHPWTLVVDHRAWTPKQRRLFRDEFESVANDAREKQLVPMAFAIANQSSVNLADLEVARASHVAFIAGPRMTSSTTAS